MNQTATQQGNGLLNGGYTYFAFISYKRQDEKWARWLKKRLQTYRLPNKTHRRHKELPLRCVPVFMDKTNLTPGPLEEELRDEVQSSKFLIVICSRAAHDNSKYLDIETRLFLEGGGTPDRIIPFIVDKSDKPEKECFPLFFQELNERCSINGANIFDSGKRKAFLKVIAAMHGLKLEEIVSDDSRRQTRKRVFAAAAALALAAGLYFALDYYLPHTSYYLDYVEQYGVPKGIHALTPDEMRAVGNHYTFVTRQGKVRELRYENAAGQLAAHVMLDDVEAPVYNEYEYSETSGRLLRTTLYDIDKKPIMIMEYKANVNDTKSQAIDLQSPGVYSPAAFLSAHLSESNTFLYHSADRGPSAKSSITRYLVDYDENGFVMERRYVSDKDVNYSATDADGISGIRYERDALGRMTKTYLLTFVGSGLSAEDPGNYAVIGIRSGVWGYAFEYDENDNHAGTRCFGKDGAPVINPATGFCSLEAQYDSQHHQQEVCFLDTHGELMLNAEGYASYTCAYDGMGREITLRYYGVNYEPIISVYGYASREKEYNEQGKECAVSFYGLSGEPVLYEKAFWKQTTEFDDQQRVVKESNYGTDGNLISSSGQYAFATVEYPAENVEKLSYFGADGLPCLVNGASCQVIQYDKYGRDVKRSYYGPDHQLVLCGDGYAVAEYAYDRQGNVQEMKFLGTDEQPIITSYGFAGCKCVHNGSGLLEKMSYFGVDGKPVRKESGEAGFTLTYDRQLNAVKKRYFDENGNPAMVSDGFSYWTHDYDQRGNILRESYYDGEGNLTAIFDGYAVIEVDYDEYGNEAAQRFLGPDQKLTLCADGYACCAYQHIYHENGKTVRETCLGTDEQPILTVFGFFIVETEYDLYGRAVQQRYLGIHNEPVLTTDGCAGWTREYDAQGYLTRQVLWGTENENPLKAETYDRQGNVIEESLYGPDGALAPTEDGYAVIRHAYDERGNETGIAYYGADGQLVMNVSADYAAIQIAYDENDQVTGLRFLDVDENCMIAIAYTDGVRSETIYYSEGKAECVNRYDPSGNVIEKSFCGPDGAPALTEDGYAVIRYAYDERGNQIRTAYYDAEGHLVLNTDKGYAVLLMAYDDHDQVTRVDFLDADEKYLLSREYIDGVRVKNIYYKDGKLDHVYRYDANGAIIEKSWYGPDGALKSTVEYDAEGNVIREQKSGGQETGQ